MEMDKEHHLLVINRTGSGEVFHFPVDESHCHLLKTKPTVEEWDATARISDFGVVVCERCLYVLGGYVKNEKKYLDRVMCFDPRNSEWYEKKPMLTPRAKFSVSVFENKIYVAGGEKGPNKYTASTECYSPVTDQWNKAGMLPEGRLYHGMTPLETYLCTSGGITYGQVNENIWLYERHSWTNLDDDYPQRLQHPTYKHAMLTIDDRVYFVGGIQEKEDKYGKKQMIASNTVESFRPAVPVTDPQDLEDIDDDSPIPEDEEGSFGLQTDLICPWELHPLLPRLKHGRHSAGAVVLGSSIHVFGGSDINGECVRQSERIDLETKKREDGVTIKKGNVADVVCAIVRYGPDASNYELQISSRFISNGNGDTDSLNGSGRAQGAGLMQPKGFVLW